LLCSYRLHRLSSAEQICFFFVPFSFFDLNAGHSIHEENETLLDTLAFPRSILLPFSSFVHIVTMAGSSVDSLIAAFCL
jgi:hypothetical protein